MKQHILVAFAIILSVPVFAQENVKLQGTIKADSLQESAVHVINLTQKIGTVNNSSGNFQILVRENDTLLFSSIQFKKISVAVTSSILERGRLDIALVEDVNELPVVNISNINLSGNINTDISNIEIVRDMPVSVNFDAVKNITFEADADDPHGSAPTNLAYQQNQIGSAGGLNIIGGVGLLVDLFSGKKDKKVIPAPVVPNTLQLRKLFEDEFFKSSIGIKEEYIADFINYLDENGLTAQMLKKENRLSLIEYMMEKGKQYKDSRSGN